MRRDDGFVWIEEFSRGFEVSKGTVDGYRGMVMGCAGNSGRIADCLDKL